MQKQGEFLRQSMQFLKVLSSATECEGVCELACAQHCGEGDMTTFCLRLRGVGGVLGLHVKQEGRKWPRLQRTHCHPGA
jgi:hypothetical protein